MSDPRDEQNAFKQHVPAFVDLEKYPEWIPFDTTKELLGLEVVRRYIGPTFSHFAISDNTLMEISDEGFHHWVVGFIRYPERVDLPKWAGWKHLVRLKDGREVVLTDEVVSSCGGVLTLRDGSKGHDVLYERQMAKQEADRKKRDAGICPKCDIRYIVTEAPDTNKMIRVESRCATCGAGMTSWRKP